MKTAKQKNLIPLNTIIAHIKVLVVEDNPGDQFLLAEQLRTVIPNRDLIYMTDTLSGATALLDQITPDIILLDLSLPDSTGIETFEFINQLCPATPIVILSGLEDTNLAIQAIALGAQDYLQKGDFDENLLSRSIRYSMERKKSLEELKVSIERYTLVSKATNDIVWDWDIPKNTVYRNEEQFCRMLKLPPHLKDSGGEFWIGRVHPEDATWIGEEIARILSNPEKMFFELEYRFLDGMNQYLYLLDRGYIIRNEDGAPLRLIGSTQDISKQKEINNELQKLSLIARETQNGVIITNKDKKIEWVNHAFEQISGYTLEEIKGKNPGKVLQGKETDPKQVAFMRSQFERQKSFEVELINYHKQGKKYWIHLQVQPIFDEKGQLQQYFSIQSDITAEKRAEEALKRSEEQYRYLFDNNPAVIMIWNIDDFSIAEVNESFLKFYGYSREEIATLTIKDIRPPDDIPLIEEFARNAKKVESINVNRQWRHLKKNGQLMYMQISSQKIIYKNRAAILAIAIDITEKKILEQRLEQERQAKADEITNAVLAAQENEKEYIGRELHDNVNQILASSRLYLGLAAVKGGSEDIRSADNLLNKAIEEIRVLSHSLIPPSFQKINLLESIDQVLHIYETGTPIQFSKHYHHVNSRFLQEKVQLTIYRAVQEQLNNILKHASATQVIIDIHQTTDELLLTISDNGNGFDTNKKHLGIGLMNIQTRAGLCNGQMEIESAPGMGCTLKVLFRL